MATRLYFPNSDSYPADVTPSSWSAGWNKTSGAASDRALMQRTISSGDATTDTANTGSGTSGHFTAIRRWISQPLGGAQTITGTVKGQFQCFEQVSTANYTLAIAIKVIQPDGSDRGVLLATTASDNTAASPPEMATVRANRQMLDASESASISLGSVSASNGDRIVVEVGFRQASTATDNAHIFSGFGGGGADLGENNTSTSTTENPWIEFSQDIDFFGYFGSESTPVDSSTATNTADPTAISSVTIPAATGDLVVMVGHQRATGATLAISNNGGQSWTTENAIGGTNITARLFWCIFDGTWDADPSVDFSATTCNSVSIHVFKAPSGYTWSVNQALTEDDNGAAPHTITGQTTTGSNPTITIAGWFTADDNTWGTVSGTGWTSFGSQQYRNTSGSDQSASFALKYQNAAGATGNVTKNQATLGDDASSCFIITFAAATSGSAATAEGTGAATAVGQATVSRDVSASGAGAAAAVGNAIIERAGTSAGVGTASAAIGIVGSAEGTGTASGAGAATVSAVGTAIGIGLAGAFSPVPEGVSGFDSTGRLAVGRYRQVVVAVSEMVGTATGSGAAAAQAGSQAVASGTGTAAALSETIVAVAGTASGTGTATAIGAATAASAGLAAGTGTATAVGTGINALVGSASGTGTATATGVAVAASAGTAAGTGAAAALSIAIVALDGSASGTGAAAAIGAATAASVGSADATGVATGVSEAGTAIGEASGTGTAAATGTAITATVGSASGTGAAAAAGNAIIARAGNAAGAGTATALSVATVARAGSAAGTGTASAVGQTTVARAGSASGTGTAAGISAAGTAVGTASGTGNASAVGIAIAAVVGTATGAGAATADATAIVAAVGTASGAGAAAAVGAIATATTDAVGNASGVGTASAVGERSVIFYDFPVGRRLDSDYGIRGSKLGRRRLVTGRR